MATFAEMKEEGMRLRNLGFFARARHSFEAALEVRPDDVELTIAMAGMSMEQGLLGDCRDRIVRAPELINMDSLDPEELAVFGMLSAVAEAVTSARFEQPLRNAVGIFQATVYGRAVHEVQGRLVTVAAAYHTLVSLALNVGFVPGEPCPIFSVEFQDALANSLLSKGRYSEAIKIARLARYSNESFDNTRVLEAILSDSRLPQMTRADASLAYASTLFRLGNNRDDATKALEEARRIYEDEGHAFGAAEARLELIKMNLPTSEPDHTAKELWLIKDHMQRVENWAGVSQCLMAISEVNESKGMSALSDDALRVWETEWQIARHTTQNTIHWATQTGLKISEWLAGGAVSGRMVTVLEDYLDQVSGLDVPAMIGNAFRHLRSIYLLIGEAEKAELLLARYRQVLPPWILRLEGLDDFSQAVHDYRSDSSSPDGELEMIEEEIGTVQLAMLRNIDSEYRNLEVLRLVNLAREYMFQHEIRGLESTGQLVERLCIAIEAFIPLLRQKDGKRQTAGVLQLRALLLSIQAENTAGVDAAAQLICQSLSKEAEAAAIFREEGSHLLAGTSRNQTGLRMQTLWQLRGYPSDSDDFRGAVDALEEARESFLRFGTLEAQEMNCRYLVDAWSIATLHPQVRLGSGWVKPREQLMRWIEESEKLGSTRRSDLSAMGRLRGVLAKQFIAAGETSQPIYAAAIGACAGAGDVRGVWNWAQKTKARSISDTLALGVYLPSDLRAAVDADDEMKAMVEKEAALVSEVDSAVSEHRFTARLALEAHRKEMRERQILRHLFEYREGQIASVERLQGIGEEFFSTTGKHVYFVDWFQFPGMDNFFLHVVSHLGLSFFKLDFSSVQVKAWKERDFFAKPKGRGAAGSSLRPPVKKSSGNKIKEDENAPPDPSQEPLRQLKPLIKPLIDLVDPGDLLVFCVTGELHGVPLHAAIVDGKDTAVIELCPVIYTASMTTFAHCVARESDRSRNGQPISRGYAAVYEHTETSALDGDSLKMRDELYGQVAELEFDRPNATALCGWAVTQESFSRVFQNDYVCFVGHAGGGMSDEDVLHKGLFLAPKEQKDASIFTVADMFDTDVKTSAFILLACESARERHGSGDEPLGIATALLCAGANTVIGTMWKIPLTTAMDALSTLERLLLEEQKDGSKSVFNLAAVVQGAVRRMKQELGLDPFDWASLIVNGSWMLSR